MHLFLLGVSHHTAPVQVRERLAFGTESLDRALRLIAQLPGISEIVVLSTCNRVELYATCGDVGQAHRILSSFLGDFHGVPLDFLEPHVYSRIDAEAASHLFRVAAGLDSLVIGEPQILGQVKEAFTAAADRQCTGARLNRLFHAAFGVGKRVRRETGLSEGAVSVSYAAISLARKIFGDLTGRSVLVVGAGEMAKLTAIHLRAQRVRRISVTSRTPENAEALARRVDGAAIAWHEIPAALAGSDIVITATGAAAPVLTLPVVEEAMRARRNRPLFVIDIGLPRDVEFAAGELEQVFLYNIDDLKSIVSDNLARRSGELAQAEAIVTEEVALFLAWLRSRDAVPTVVALRQRFEAIRQAELERLEPKLAGLPPEARVRVDEITRLIVEKLLLTPTEQLKAAADRETVLVYADALRRLFSLSPGSAGTALVEPDERPPNPPLVPS
jgi:glutamyl-tRNA reductase